MKPLEGIWQLVYAELDGEEVPMGLLQIPAWHGKALQETQQLVKSGKAQFSDWDEAKARLRRKTAKIA